MPGWRPRKVVCKASLRRRRLWEATCVGVPQIGGGPTSSVGRRDFTSLLGLGRAWRAWFVLLLHPVGYRLLAVEVVPSRVPRSSRPPPKFSLSVLLASSHGSRCDDDGDLKTVLARAGGRQISVRTQHSCIFVAYPVLERKTTTEFNESTMDGQWPQQNSHGADLTMISYGQYNIMSQDHGDDFDGHLGVGHNTNMGNTGAAAAADQAGDSSGGETAGRRHNRKRHKREQIQILEAVYQETPHPDETHRRELGMRVGMTELQVKFWFQNRRSAQKTKEQKRQIKKLQEAHETLQAEHGALRSATENNSCPTCTAVDGSRLDQLLAENARLREQLRRAQALRASSSRRRAEATAPLSMMPPAATNHALPSSSSSRRGALLANPMVPPASGGGSARSQRDTDAMLADIAGRAMQEFCTLVSVGAPVWLPAHDNGEVLDFQQYAEAMFPSIFGPYRAGSVLDGTRKSGDVRREADDLVAIFMDAARWSEMFPGIVASAAVRRVIPPSASQDRMIQLPGKWAVVDASFDGILGHEDGGAPSTCRLLPSGCLIEVKDSSSCKVTWIVNMEYDETTMSAMYHPLIRSGQALGACRWLASFQWQSDYLATMYSDPSPALGDTDITPSGRRKIFEVAQCMTRSFYEAMMCGPRAQPWRSVNGWRGGCGTGFERFEVVAKVVTFFANNGAPGSVVLRARTTLWLPGIPAQQVFDYLRDGYHRGEWDSLANGAPILEEGCFSTGNLTGNVISILRTLASDGTNGNLILQEARTDASCMVLAYATMDDHFMQRAMHNGGLATLSLLPSGLVILPDGHSHPLAPPTSPACSSSIATGHRSNTGSFVSVMYQTLLSGQQPVKPSLESIDNVGNMLCRVIRKIKDVVQTNNIVIA
uniref:Uncharacterized protein n=1 Tax=Avena sativa TaxID=4498 RepID=A0ACD5ZL64_AVESA